MKKLVEGGRLPLDTPDNRGETPLHMAAALGDGHEALEAAALSLARQVVEILARNPGTSLEVWG